MHHSTTPGTTSTRPTLMQRLRGKRTTHSTHTNTKHSHNPITGANTTTTTEKVTEHGHGHHNGHTTTSTPTTTTGGGRMSRRNRRKHHGHTASTGSTTANGVGGVGHHHHQRRPSLGDKVSGALMRVRGSLTRRPGLKACLFPSLIEQDQSTDPPL